MIRSLLILSFSLIGFATIAQSASGTMSLQECISYALENNQNVKNAQLSLDISKYRVGEILADGLPQLSASADLGYNFKVPTSFIPAEFFGGEVGTFAPVQFSPAYNGSAGVDLSQMLFDGSYFVGLKASRIYTDLSRKDKIKSEIDVIEAVSKAYYLVLVNQDQRELIEKSYNRLDTLLSDTK
ncbi:MAG: TolC family protein, partial [Cyclobacteriaceae bacterium]